MSGWAQVTDKLFERLEAARTEATEKRRSVPFEFGGVPCQVAPHAFGRYRFCIVHRFGQFGVTRSKTLPPLYIQPRAECLHGMGAAETVAWFLRMIEAECGATRLSTSRLDLHADWQGWIIDGDDRDKFVTYADVLLLRCRPPAT
jgi:hypothetical protein